MVVMSRRGLVCRRGATLALFALALGRGAQADPATHVVEPGQSLWTISRAHGCSLQALRGANTLASEVLRSGQRLVVPRCDPPPTTVPVMSATLAANIPEAPPMVMSGLGIVHYVTPGESLHKIALHYRTTIQDVAIRNRLIGQVIRPGQQLLVMPGNRTVDEVLVGQSVGKPHEGRLIHALQLTTVRGMYVRHPGRAYGANHTVYHIKRVVRTVMAEHPDLHAVAIGDLSTRTGGEIGGHGSHESGRDVDLGFYFKKRPRGYPESFARGSSATLHFPAMWTVLTTLAATTSSPSGVERIFLDYDVQALMYHFGQKQGVPERTLTYLFQYPSGRTSPSGLARHEPNHEDHFHVRFKCPQGDQKCR